MAKRVLAKHGPIGPKSSLVNFNIAQSPFHPTSHMWIDGTYGISFNGSDIGKKFSVFAYGKFPQNDKIENQVSTLRLFSFTSHILNIL